MKIHELLRAAEEQLSPEAAAYWNGADRSLRDELVADVLAISLDEFRLAHVVAEMEAIAQPEPEVEPSNN